ncbi:MAG: hypothetical protein ACI9OJ_002825 [Myxococcota bacterium]|jgi:hypothetical protein
MSLKHILRLLTASLLSLGLVGCLLGPVEETEAEAEESQYETQAEPLRLEPKNNINPMTIEGLPGDDEIGHGTPDPLDPLYQNGPGRQAPIWNE